MANPSYVEFTPGSGGKTSTYLINPGTGDQHIQRMAPNTPEGEDASIGSFKQVDLTVTRPANTTPYSVNDAWSDSASSPATGGFNFANASRGAGKSGLITDLIVFGSAAPATLLQGELWLFGDTITNINDNAAFALALTDLRKLVARIEFTMEAAVASPAAVAMKEVAVNQAFTTVGNGNLYGLIRVTNAYTPASGEALTFRLKCMRLD